MLPPGKVYPLPGTCKTSLMNINRVSWTLILDPFEERIEYKLPSIFIWKELFSPSNWSSMGSIFWSSPIDHPTNLSVKVFSILILNSLNDTPTPVVGIPVAPPIGTVKICSFPYPYPYTS